MFLLSHIDTIVRFCRLSPDFLLLISVASLPCLLVIISLSKWLTLLAISSAVMGISLGVIDCLANLQLVNLYDKAVAPFLQVQNDFGFYFYPFPTIIVKLQG